MAHIFSNLFKGSKPENGELTINLNLTIKIEADGSLKVTPTASTAEKPIEAAKKETTETIYEIPDFGSDESLLINFGKKD